MASISRAVRRGRAGAAGALGITLLAGGCSGALPHSVASAPVLSVAVGLWPLAEAASAIGGDKVHVLDIVPQGADPLTYQPTAATTAGIRTAGLVIEVGGGFQPAVEQAVQEARSVTRLAADLRTSDPYVWLDPPTMARAAQVIAAAMSGADPAAASLYRRNAGAFEQQARSLGIDFSSTLSACPGHDLVTPDGAFSSMAASYGLIDHPVGAAPTAGRIAALRAGFPPAGPVAVLAEPWLDDGGVEAVAATAHLKVHAVDTLAATPSGPGNYFSRMEQNLGVISAALGCNAAEQ